MDKYDLINWISGKISEGKHVTNSEIRSVINSFVGDYEKNTELIKNGIKAKAIFDTKTQEYLMWDGEEWTSEEGFIHAMPNYYKIGSFIEDFKLPSTAVLVDVIVTQKIE